MIKAPIAERAYSVNSKTSEPLTGRGLDRCTVSESLRPRPEPQTSVCGRTLPSSHALHRFEEFHDSEGGHDHRCGRAGPVFHGAHVAQCAAPIRGAPSARSSFLVGCGRSDDQAPDRFRQAGIAGLLEKYPGIAPDVSGQKKETLCQVRSGLLHAAEKLLPVPSRHEQIAYERCFERVGEFLFFPHRGGPAVFSSIGTPLEHAKTRLDEQQPAAKRDGKGSKPPRHIETRLKSRPCSSSRAFDSEFAPVTEQIARRPRSSDQPRASS